MFEVSPTTGAGLWCIYWRHVWGLTGNYKLSLFNLNFPKDPTATGFPDHTLLRFCGVHTFFLLDTSWWFDLLAAGWVDIKLLILYSSLSLFWWASSPRPNLPDEPLIEAFLVLAYLNNIWVFFFVVSYGTLVYARHKKLPIVLFSNNLFLVLNTLIKYAKTSAHRLLHCIQ